MNIKELQQSIRLVKEHAERYEWCFWGNTRKNYCLTVHWLRGGQRLFHTMQSVIDHLEDSSMNKDELFTKEQAYDLGLAHGMEMAQESGSREPGCDGWDGMLINADPTFAKKKFGWSGQNTTDESKELMDEYCRGCQDGADSYVKVES